MGQSQSQSICCAQKRYDFSVDWINDQLVHGLPSTHDGASSSSAGRPKQLSAFGDGFGEQALDGLGEQAGWQSRGHQPFESAALIPALYEVQPAKPNESQHAAVAAHRKTGAQRRLLSHRKPRGPAAQERLRTYLLSVQRLSAASASCARVHEVFEDFKNVHLACELCTGGPVYDRILDRQHFTEQESALLVRHMLQALVPFHEQRLYHGSLTPDSFRFLNDSPLAPLKLIDFGVDLKVHRWDAVEHVSGGPDLQNPHFPQFFETCKLVFSAPELVPPPGRKERAVRPLLSSPHEWLAAQEVSSQAAPCAMGAPSGGIDPLDGELLADVLDEHADWFELQARSNFAQDYSRRSEATDMWSIGAIAFLLLCGYPPFFAPSRNAVLGRIQLGEVAFDAPFWSKISEDAKAFVSGCLKVSCWDRASLQEALAHPWIQSLADESPSGTMIPPFMLNLRRFYRTSLIEVYVANELAAKLRREDMFDFLRRCREIDMCCSGFFTSSDLKHVLTALGHAPVAEAITALFLRAFRHPGESYIDYVALLDSALLRQQWLFEEELWCHFQRVCQSCGQDEAGSGFLPLEDLDSFLRDPVVVGLLMQEVPQSAGVDQGKVCQRLQSSVREHCQRQGVDQLDFRSLLAILLRLVCSYTSESHRDVVWLGEVEALATEVMNSVL